MPIKNTRSIIVVFIVLLFGCIIGSAVSELFTYILPDGVVKDFFTKTWTIIGWGDKN